MKYTKSAKAYVGAQREALGRDPDWFDICAAYDAGLLHAANRTEDAQSQLAELGNVRRDEDIRSSRAGS